jgi:hypothetical protein
MLLSERPNDRSKRKKAETVLFSLVTGFGNNKFEKKDYSDIGLGWVWITESAYPNLYLKFNTDNDDIFVSVLGNENKKAYILNVGCNNTCNNKKLIYPKEILIDLEDKLMHEIIHILTMDEIPVKRRKFFKAQDMVNDKAGYMNSSQEWEAYFQQVAHYFDDIVGEIKYRYRDSDERLQAFKDKIAETPQDFSTSFWWRFQGLGYGVLQDVIDDKYKKKWEKRIYQLYNEYIEFLSKSSSKYETINRVVGAPMKSNLQVHLESRLKTILEAEGDEKPAEAAPAEKPAEDAAPAEGEDAGDDFFSQDEVDSAKGGDAKDAPEGNEEAPEDQAGPGMAGAGDGEGGGVSDDEKMRQLFTETGDPEVDYGLTSEANIRLAKFKFKNANVDPLTMMDESELTEGIRVDELESRLTPDQYDLYRSKWKEVRRDFPKIAEREQKVVIYNSNVPFFYNDEAGNAVSVEHKRDVNTAIDKLNKYMTRNFTEDWVDNKKAVKFLQGVRINFSEEPKIRPNLISAKFFEEYEDRDLVPFNKLHSDIPESVRKFLKDNLEMDSFKKSSVFRTLSNDYVGDNSGSSRTSVYAVIKGEEAPEGADGAEGEDPNADPDAADAGAEGDAGDIGGDVEADTGADTGEDAGADAGGEDLGL